MKEMKSYILGCWLYRTCINTYTSPVHGGFGERKEIAVAVLGTQFSMEMETMVILNLSSLLSHSRMNLYVLSDLRILRVFVLGGEGISWSCPFPRPSSRPRQAGRQALQAGRQAGPAGSPAA